MNDSLFRCLGIVSLMLVLSACGSTDEELAGEPVGNPSDEIIDVVDDVEGELEEQAEILKGVFLDSPVAGACYRSYNSEGVLTHEGTTSVEGEYNYEEGDSVTFCIGGFDFPSIPASGVVTPADMANQEAIRAGNNETVRAYILVNTLRFLQTLDQDGNPDNGITISNEAHEATNLLADSEGNVEIELAIPPEEFESSSSIVSIISSAGQDTPVTVLISEEQAVQHFENQISGYLPGVWSFKRFPDSRVPEIANLIILKENNNYSYYCGEFDEAGKGMESGGFQLKDELGQNVNDVIIDQSTIRVYAEADTDDVSAEIISTCLFGSDRSEMSATVGLRANELTFTEKDTTGGIFELEKIALKDQGIESVWRQYTTAYGVFNESKVLVFLADNRYLELTAFDFITGDSTYEAGTYQLQDETLTTTASAYDDGAVAGLLNPARSTGAVANKVVILGDKLTLTNADGDFTFTRQNQ